MTWFERSQPLLILLSVLPGLGLALIGDVAALAGQFMIPLLMGMLYAAFLPIPLRHLGRAFGNYRVTLASLAVNFVWTPLLDWGLGALFLRDAPDLRVGLLMLMVTPCTDWYLVFTGIAKGNVSLATALLPLNLVLQMVLLPVYLALFAQALVSLDLGVLVGKIATVLLIPLALALLSRYGMGWLKGPTWLHQKLSQVAMVPSVFWPGLPSFCWYQEGSVRSQLLDPSSNPVHVVSKGLTKLFLKCSFFRFDLELSQVNHADWQH